MVLKIVQNNVATVLDPSGYAVTVQIPDAGFVALDNQIAGVVCPGVVIFKFYIAAIDQVNQGIYFVSIVIDLTLIQKAEVIYKNVIGGIEKLQ